MVITYIHRCEIMTHIHGNESGRNTSELNLWYSLGKIQLITKFDINFLIFTGKQSLTFHANCLEISNFHSLGIIFQDVVSRIFTQHARSYYY